MTEESRQLLERAMQLSLAERRALAHRLLDTCDDRMDPAVLQAWENLAAERMAAIRSGKAKTVPWSEVRQELWGIVNEAKAR